MLVTDLIARDHRQIQHLFLEMEEARPPAREALGRLVAELDVHAQAEEAVFYPAVRSVSRRIDDAEAAHGFMRELIETVTAAEPGSRPFALALMQLKQAVLDHAMEEEGGILLEAARLGPARLEELGAAMEEEKQKLIQAQLQPGRRAA
jgi:hemerythrin superfamily protein